MLAFLLSRLHNLYLWFLNDGHNVNGFLNLINSIIEQEQANRLQKRTKQKSTNLKYTMSNLCSSLTHYLLLDIGTITEHTDSFFFGIYISYHQYCCIQTMRTRQTIQLHNVKNYKYSELQQAHSVGYKTL